MYAQALWFDGPRSPEVVAAQERAGIERIEPAISAQADLMESLVATVVMRRADGGELVLTITESESALDLSNTVVMSTELLPGEDPALLTGPDRTERYEVVHTILGKSVLR